MVAVRSLDTGDHSVDGNGLDGSDLDQAMIVTTRPIFGLHRPDVQVSYQVDRQTDYTTVHEWDAREIDGLEDEIDYADVTLDPTIFPDASEQEHDEVVGHLNITNTPGNKDRESDCDVLHTFGGRSLSIRDAEGNLAYGGDDMPEQLSARFALAGQRPR